MRQVNFSFFDSLDRGGAALHDALTTLLRGPIYRLPTVMAARQILSLHPNFIPNVKVPDGVIEICQRLIINVPMSA